MGKEKNEKEEMNKINISISPAVKKIIGFDNEKEKSTIQVSPFVVNILGLSDDFINIENSVRAINDYSAGLSFAIPDQKVFSEYAIAVESQRTALDSVLQIGEKFKIENDKLVLAINKTVSPLTNIIENISSNKNEFYGLDSIVNKFKIENDQLVSFIDSTVLPISNAMADIGLASVNAAKLYGLGSINKEQLQLTQNVSGLVLETIKGHQDILNENLAIVEKSGILKFINELSPSVKVVSNGISEMMRSLPVFPLDVEVSLPSLKATRKSLEVSKKENSELQCRLDEILYEIDPDLVEFRKGVWETFDCKGKDYIGQSSSSMRRLVDNLLRALAPQEKVVETNFFKTSKNGKDDKGRPTRKARFLYLVNWDKNKAEHLMRVVDSLLGLYDNLSAWDHAPLQKHNFVHGTLIAIEGHLLSILAVDKE